MEEKGVRKKEEKRVTPHAITQKEVGELEAQSPFIRKSKP